MQYSQGNTCVKVSKKETSTKVFSCEYCTISKKKETLALVFSCEICKIFEISSFKEHFRATASILIACNTNYLVFFFFLLTYLIFIHWFFSSLGLLVLSYILSDYDDTNTFWLLYIWTLIIDCHLVFFFESMSWSKGKKYRKIPVDVLPMVLENPNSLSPLCNLLYNKCKIFELFGSILGKSG